MIAGSRWLLTLLVLILLLSGCQDGAISGALIWQGDHTYQPNDVVQGHLVLLDGMVHLQPGSLVSGSVFMLGGDLEIGGEISGDVAILAGDLFLAPGAQIDGDLSMGGGKIERAPGASIRGMVRGESDSRLNLESLFPRLSVRDRLLRLLPETLLVAALAYVAARLLDQPLDHVRRAAVSHPIISTAMGALLILVIPTLLVLMAFTVILIPVTVVALLLAGAVVIYAWIALGMVLGYWLRDRLKRDWTAPAAAFLGTMLFMALTNLLGLVPYAGSWIGLLATTTGIGAVFLTRFGLRPFVPAYEFAPPSRPR